MSKNGVWQLNKLCLSYCDVGGSSKIAKQFVDSGKLFDFAKTNPQTEFFVELRRNRHPHIKAYYLNGRCESHNLYKKSPEEIQLKLDQLKDKWGNKARKIGDSYVLRPNKSIQGEWSPYLWMRNSKY